MIAGVCEANTRGSFRLFKGAVGGIANLLCSGLGRISSSGVSSTLVVRAVGARVAVLASPSHLLASPSELFASPSELLASLSELVASPSELLAAPSEL